MATAVDVTDPAEIQRRGLDHAFKHITFNIELVKEAAVVLQLKLNAVALVLN